LISYGPYWAWKELEGGKIKKLCSDMLIFPYTEDRDSKVDRYVAIVLIQTYYNNDDIHRLLQGSKEKDQNENYRKSFQILELLSLGSLTFNFYILGPFLGPEYYTYGINYIQYLCGEKKNPSNILFPKMAKCFYHRYGVGGKITYIFI
jgi:hypothetical protein